MSHPTTPQRAQRGASLIEVMMSMLILAIGILGVLQMSGLASQQNALATRESTASLIARDLVDVIDRMPYAHPALGGTALMTSADFHPQVIFDREHNIENFDAWPGAMPILGATPAILTADMQNGNLGGIEWVGWTVRPEIIDGVVMSKQVEITVRFRMPGTDGNNVPRTRDLRFWTAKYNPQAVVGAASANFTEI